MTDPSNERLMVVNAMLDVARNPDRLLAAVAPASSKVDAVARVQVALGVDEVVAHHLLDLQFSAVAHYRRTALKEEADLLREALS